MALSKDLTILSVDISVALMKTPMPGGDPVYVETLEGLHEYNDTVWRLKIALKGLRDASRLVHEHFYTIRSTANALRGSFVTHSLQCTSMI